MKLRNVQLASVVYVSQSPENTDEHDPTWPESKLTKSGQDRSYLNHFGRRPQSRSFHQ
jgi:hypothetical protein